MKIGIFGAGFSGRKIGTRFASNNIPVWGSSRNPANFDTLKSAGLFPVVFDGERLTDELKDQLAETTYLIVSIAPAREENTVQPDAMVDPVLSALAGARLLSLAPKLKWVGYLSTVGVYGNHDGAWVDEDIPAAPASQRSRQRVRAESEWIAFGKAEGLPVGLFRLSGIYGPGRNALTTAHKGKSRRMIKPGQVFNRIHVDDIAQALELAASKEAAGTFNITDDEPAPPQDVVSFAHTLMGTEPPVEIDFETADISPMARSFYGENKRVSNAKSKQELGLTYAYPNYRAALTRMWEEGNW